MVSCFPAGAGEGQESLLRASTAQTGGRRQLGSCGHLGVLSHFVSQSCDSRRKGHGGSAARSLVVSRPASGVARASLTLTCVAPRPPCPVLSHGAARQVATPVTALAGGASRWPASLRPADHSLLRAPLLRITGDTAGSTPSVSRGAFQDGSSWPRNGHTWDSSRFGCIPQR